MNKILQTIRLIEHPAKNIRKIYENAHYAMSCMSHCGAALDWYGKQKNLSIVTLEFGENVVGRALVWRNVKIIKSNSIVYKAGKSTTLVDLTYFGDDDSGTVPLFEGTNLDIDNIDFKAILKQYLGDALYTEYPQYGQQSVLFRDKDNILIKAWLEFRVTATTNKQTGYDYDPYPYVDTLRYLDKKRRILTNVRNALTLGSLRLRETDCGEAYTIFAYNDYE